MSSEQIELELAEHMVGAINKIRTELYERAAALSGERLRYRNQLDYALAELNDAESACKRWVSLAMQHIAWIDMDRAKQSTGESNVNA